MLRMKLILILSVLLQLTILVEGKAVPVSETDKKEQYTFGDIIAFPRLPLKRNGALYTYAHYAIYVGDKEFLHKKTGEDISHITGVPVSKLLKYGLSSCIFGKLSDEGGNHRKDNYLDGQISKRNDDEIVEDINNLFNNCGKRHPTKNNCEHLATHLRYGEKHFQQNNTALQKLLKKDEEPVQEKTPKSKRDFPEWLIETSANQASSAA
uniref:HRAS-like suppressor 2 n=1 Tax=Esox lucius TaxID=8010 RepID=C1BYW1_ESOLU|nr:uncharacterized protein LOC105008735 precursor [Esox lucius]ACO14214.1 HRAS-like suppressor 2 [Esox lucius]